jgi:hypothetical protein
MDRRKFLMGLGVLPFVSTSLFAINSTNDKKEFVLVGLGDSGDTVTREIQKMGFKGKVYNIQVAKADNLHIRLTERLLHGEEISDQPNRLLSKFSKSEYEIPIFISGLGGIRSTYLSALIYHEMRKSGKSFHMFLTTPFEFEGPLRNTRAKKFQLATDSDMSIKYINLNDCPRDIWSTVSDSFNKFPAMKIYQILRGMNYY